jgi:O-antigen/teichoic acid export membrane protein
MQLARSLARNVAILLASQVLTSLLGMVTVLLLPIFLGDVGLGRYAFATSLCGVLGALIVLGTNTYIVREVAADHDRLPDLVGTSLGLRAPLWVVTGAVTFPLLALRGMPREALATVAVLYAVTLASVLNGSLASALQGLERMGRKSVAAVAGSAVVLAVGLPVLILTRSPAGFGAAMAAGAAVELGINAAALRTLRRRLPRPRLRGVVALSVGAAPFMTLAVSQGVYSQIDIVMTTVLAGEAAAGWLAAATRLSTVVMLVPVVMAGALLPAMARLLPGDVEAAGAALRRILDVVVLLVLPATLGLAAIAPRLFGFLRYPPAFSGSVPILVVLCVCWAVTAVAIVLGSAALSAGRQRQWAIGNAVLVVLLLVLNAALIPLARALWSNGGVGAALANLLGEVAITAFAMWLLPAGLLRRESAGQAARALLASLVMAALVLAASDLPLPLVIPGGAVVYVAASLALGTLRPGDVRLLSGLLRRRADAGALLAVEPARDCAV